MTHAELLRKTADRYSKFGGDENLLVVAIRAGAEALDAVARLKAEAEANQRKVDEWDIASQLPGVDVPASDKLGISRLVEINHALRGDAEIAKIEHQRLTAERDAALAKLAQAREVRRKPAGRAQCPRCSKWVTLWAETEEWTQTRTGKWKHSAYGPGAAECCNLVMLDSPWDGLMVFKWGPRPAPPKT